MELSALAEQGLDTDELDSLVEQGLARQGDVDFYDVHDLIREFLVRSLDESTKQEFHAKCCNWYEKQTSAPAILIEHIYLYPFRKG